MQKLTGDDDEQVLAYIQANDPMNREAVENGADPYRYWQAKRQRGENTYRSLHSHLTKIARKEASDHHSGGFSYE
jgi:hypothetical protein